MPSRDLDLTRTWRRSRWGATAALALLALGSAITLVNGHWLHGGLMALGAALLVKGSVFGRRSRRHSWQEAEAQTQTQAVHSALSAPQGAPRKVA